MVSWLKLVAHTFPTNPYLVVGFWWAALDGFQYMMFLGGSDSKESACNAGEPGSVPGLGRSSGEGNGYPLQYTCLENSMDRGA